jgi:protein-S-isoprenylcysteine O-methyltransferase Ste14
VVHADITRAVALSALVPAIATLHFFVFWTWFAFWRRHPAALYTMAFALIAGFVAAIIVLRGPLLQTAVDLPGAVRVLGWLITAAACVFGTIADRQIGFRIRAFAPFFNPGEKIELRTRGAYGVVRHPIYASGLWFQLGVFLATGYVAVAVAAVVFGSGALWFTRQEERRLVELLADPAAYARYRDRVPALFPRLRRHGGEDRRV